MTVLIFVVVFSSLHLQNLAQWLDHLKYPVATYGMNECCLPLRNVKPNTFILAFMFIYQSPEIGFFLPKS